MSADCNDEVRALRESVDWAMSEVERIRRAVEEEAVSRRRVLKEVWDEFHVLAAELDELRDKVNGLIR